MGAISVDPGPLERFRAVVEDNPATMDVIVQRLTDGEPLKAIARSWDVPYGKLAEWITEDRERVERYSAALRIWADSLAQECVAISDEQGEVVNENGKVFDPDVARDKLRIDTRLKLAGKLDRARYGDQTELKHTGSVSLVAVLSSMPRGVIEKDVTPSLEETATVTLPTPAEGRI